MRQLLSSPLILLACLALTTAELRGQYRPAQNNQIKKIAKDQVLHTTRTMGKCSDLRAVYYPTFDEINKTLASSSLSADQKAQRVAQLEARLPTRIQLSDTLVRSRFTRPTPVADITQLPNAVGYGAKSWNNLYDALPRIRNLPVKVSPFFNILFDEKEKQFLKTIRAPRDGFYPWTIIYDCETVLEVGQPNAPAGQRFLLVHSDMDMDADGSDGARRPDPKNYSKDGAFQPEASYRWNEKPRVENPFVQKWQTRRDQAYSRIRTLEGQLAQWQGLRGKYGHQIDEDIATIEKKLGEERYEANKAAGRVRDISVARHYVGELDYFVVVPTLWTTDLYKNSPFAPSVGDFAMVFYNNKIYPCLFADQGPNYKAGEASLALAKQIVADNPRLQNRKISAEFSPFYDLEVTYIIFPGTAKPKETWGVPNLQQWNRECEQLLRNLGGLANGFTMHQW